MRVGPGRLLRQIVDRNPSASTIAPARLDRIPARLCVSARFDLNAVLDRQRRPRAPPDPAQVERQIVPVRPELELQVLLARVGDEQLADLVLPEPIGRTACSRW